MTNYNQLNESQRETITNNHLSSFFGISIHHVIILLKITIYDIPI